jgi:hypothetical protein
MIYRSEPVHGDDRSAVNEYWCRYHLGPYTVKFGGVREEDWVWGALISEILALPHFKHTIEQLERDRKLSRRDAIRILVERTHERSKLSMCCFVGDETMQRLQERMINGMGRHG